MITSVNNKVGSFMNWTSKKCSGFLEKGYKEPAKTAATMMVVSFITKDVINCAMYTTQSLNNKEIPEDKRNFVAFMDLFNGIINVFGQIGSFCLVEKYLVPFFEKQYTGVSKDPNGEKYEKTEKLLSDDKITRYAAEYMSENKAKLEKEGVEIGEIFSGENAQKFSKKIIKALGKGSSKYKDITTGVSVIVTSLATTALIKRTLTPLLATPLAARLSDSVEAGKNKKKEELKDRMYWELLAVSGGKYKKNNVDSKDSFEKQS
jgi:hypothetical protein